MSISSPAPLMWDLPTSALLPVDAESDLDVLIPQRFLVAATESLLYLIDQARQAMGSVRASRIEIQDWEKISGAQGRWLTGARFSLSDIQSACMASSILVVGPQSVHWRGTPQGGPLGGQAIDTDFLTINDLFAARRHLEQILPLRQASGDTASSASPL